MSGARTGERLGADVPRPLALRVGVAVALAIVGIAVTVPLAPAIPRTVLMPSFAAVSIAAWYGGGWAGLVTSVLCVLGVDYLVIEPVGSLTPADPADWLSMAGFIGVSSLIGGLTSRMQRARHDALALAASLDEANEKLQEQALELEVANQSLQEGTLELELQAEELQQSTRRLSEQSQAEERARRRAEEANAAKAQFLATMSHELRTPLNAIQGHVQLMELGIHGDLTTAQRDALERVQRAQRHLLGLINDILSYARLESGKVEYLLDAVAVSDVVRDVAPLVEPQLAAKGIAFTVRMDSGGPLPRVRADREKLVQVLINLLSNAQKFTPDGGRVALEVDRGAGTVRLHVRDTGIGIAPDKLEAIFEPFVQVRSGYTYTIGGTGLGLSISRDLARGMGGELTATSAPDEGSTFTLELPEA